MSKNEPILKICSQTNLKTFRFDYELTIDKFISVRKGGFRSDHFSPPGMHVPIKFYIEYLPHEDVCDMIEIHLVLCDKQQVSNIYVKFDIKGLDENGDTCFENAPSDFSKLSKSILLCGFWKSENMTDFTGDKLKILCEFTIEIDYFTTESVSHNFDSSKSIDKWQYI